MPQPYYNSKLALKLNTFMSEWPLGKRVVLALDLVRMTDEEIDAAYEDPIMIRSAILAKGEKCSWRMAIALMKAIGWEEPENWRMHPALPPTIRRKTFYAEDEEVYISKFLLPPVRPGQMLKYEKTDPDTEETRIRYGTVTNTGRIIAHDHDDEHMSPTRWARKCQDIPGLMSAMPHVFWKHVKVVK